MTSKISSSLLEWYDRHARNLPWRIPPSQSKSGILPNPYHIWLSEIMLQQTQVATVKDYYEKFLFQWPTIQDMAKAEQGDVMKAWAGLGYYSRARNLKKCAEKICSDHGGGFPQTQSELLGLPGVGPYTSAAIAAIAFHQPVPVVDGNVERVFARLFKLETPLPAAKPKIHALVSDHLEASRPGDFAQACMDLGATICLPKKPRCLLCPLATGCEAFKICEPQNYPKKSAKKAKPLRKGAAYVAVSSDEKILLCKRPQTGLLAGMTTVPTTEWNSNQDGGLGTDFAPFLADWNNRGTIKHTFTHFHLELEVWLANTDEKPETPGFWAPVNTLHDEALPTLMKKVLEKAIAGSTKAPSSLKRKGE